MKIIDNIFLAIKYIRARKFRTFLNILGIMIGVSSIITIMCVGQGGVSAVSGKLDKMGMNAITLKPASDSAESMRLRDYEYLQKMLSDVNMTPVYMNYATVEAGGSTRDVVVWGVSEGFENIYNIHLASGRFFSGPDIEKSRKTAIIEGTLARKLYGSTDSGKTARLSYRGKTMELNITGVSDDSDESFKNNFGDSVPVFIYMPVTTVMSFFNAFSIDYITIKPQSASDMDELGTKSVRLLERKTGKTGQYYAENMTKQRNVLESVLDMISLILSAVAAISLIVGALGIMNIMLVSVTERTGEIGMMKAVGAKNRDVFLQFLVEAAIITLFGASAGCLVGLSSGFIVTHFAGLPFEIQPEKIAFVITAVSLIGLIFGTYPAKLAARLDPVDALR